MTAPSPTPERPVRDLANAPAFIERQFPVSKLSKESYKERKAGAGQTLTGLGKWWGRKPLVLVRAAILGLLLPATGDPAADRETFLALMTMDGDGLLRRLKGSIPAAAVYAHATTSERGDYFTTDNGKPAWKRGVRAEDKRRLQHLTFRRMGYDDKLKYCRRPEEIDGPSKEAWERINAALRTSAANLPELIRELGVLRFGHTPSVGDVFSGGGSVPYEAARIGADAYGADLSPAAALLTWGTVNVIGGEDVVDQVQSAQRRVYEATRRKFDEWAIEQNDDGWVADIYLYCNEVVDPLTSWRVPLAPSWVIGQGTRTIARLVPVLAEKRFEFEIAQGVSDAELEQARLEGTAKDGVRCPVGADGNWLPPHQRPATSWEQLRGREGLRAWENEDLIPRPDDVFQERLYCIRWVNPATGERRYRAPAASDLEREAQVLALLRERFAAWQTKGYIPSRKIEPGDKTDEPIRTRGWTHWHHLFNPRQLLSCGLFGEAAEDICRDLQQRAGLLLSIGRCADWNSRLCR